MIREVTLNDLDRCYEIETSAYAGDEAASREKIEKRIRTYPEGFIVLELDGAVVGFVNGGATDQVQMSDEAFKELIGHDPAGKQIVIMSVVVHPEYQRRGYASKLLNAFIEKMAGMEKQAIHLMCQTELIDFYAGHGFAYSGPSASDHGGLSWHEMTLDLSAQN
ncbi:GNAT family N-acetyltransferase [Marinobacterium mangrovicola]|uniref:Ribosomal protein S18 acetylase RimI-like enzyme n=1 Tax=Marinobacterium mangrovicola TaxID=1476959 RepID=A0A4R1GAI7_9GAMM|nr:GNAT family N-acetyltransferase [Marinobacterium mangrovicola]TCK02649.1 ribosomal protein S18 acetylase RimI-like enzyme [Marinobacterium mangrovicola]